jgi:hypothetical protein
MANRTMSSDLITPTSSNGYGCLRQEGKRLYPAATKILITADGGGSNGWRLRLWKLELQTFAEKTGLPIWFVISPHRRS